MQDMTFTFPNAEFTTIAAEVKTLLGTAVSPGSSYNGQVLRIHFYENWNQNDPANIQAILDAHDPVHITAERTDGTVINVNLYKPMNLDSATELTITLDGEAVPSATPLTNNVGTAVVISVDPVTIGIDGAYPHLEQYV